MGLSLEFLVSTVETVLVLKNESHYFISYYYFLLLSDSQMVLKKCPYLLNEMVNIVAQLVGLGHAGRGKSFEWI